MAFGRHIAELRRKAGLSQEALAAESGLARSYLGGVERGQRNISLINICRLAKALALRPAHYSKPSRKARSARGVADTAEDPSAGQ